MCLVGIPQLAGQAGPVHVCAAGGALDCSVQPIAPDDPLGTLAAWNAARHAVQAELDDPERAAARYEGYFGPTTFEQTVDDFLCLDLLIHRWDLARAAGLDERLELDEVRRVHERALSFGEALRGPNVCGPAVEPPPGADEQARLLAYLGRRP